MKPVIGLEFTGGVNRLIHQRKIADNELETAQNVYLDGDGVGRTRGALTPSGDFGTAETGRIGGEGAWPRGERIAGFRFMPTTASDLMGVAVWTYFNQAYSGSGDFSYVTALDASGGILTADRLTSTVPARPVFVAFGTNVYVFPGVDGESAIIIAPVGFSGASASSFTFAGAGNAFTPRGACLYKGRFVYWGLGASYASYICWGDSGAPTTVGANVRALNGRALRVGDTDGDEIISCVEVMQTSVGSPAQSALLVLKRYSAFLITGEPNNSSDPDQSLAGIFADLSVNRISYDVGCVSHATVANTPHGTFWASDDDVWMYATGQLPARVGTKIRKVLGDTVPSERHLWFGVYHDGFYRLAVKAPGQSGYKCWDTVDFTSAIEATVNSDHEPMAHQWWLDLRQGVPNGIQDARWWGPHIYNTKFNAADAEASVKPGLYCAAVDRRPNAGDAAYTFMHVAMRDITQTGIGPPATWSWKADLFRYSFEDTGTRDTGTSSDSYLSEGFRDALDIIPDVISKEFDFGVPGLAKLFCGADMDVHLDDDLVDADLTLYTYMNGGRSSSSDTVTVASAAPAVAGDEPFQGVAFHPTDPRPRGITVQFRLTGEAGMWKFGPLSVRIRTKSRRPV
jgi:hypothetical protein